MDSRVTKAESRIEIVEAKTEELEQAASFVSSRLDILEQRNSNADNAIVTVKEQEKIISAISGETRNDDTESLLRDFLFFEIGIDRRIEYGNVHRFGKFIKGKDRPIVARFLYNADRLLVQRNSHRLAGSRYGEYEQFPSVIEERRKQLYPVKKQNKLAGNNVRLVCDRLYINGELYNGDAVQSKPTDWTIV
ncbi:uncharacterized protein LOC110457087 [Mizuhopecten yessoensis]|uniref:uncharacterized protein LOC110457087 n=1 Tax=Mizuhopecten yessoensis TaxID=6573 RepID=UPI000B45F15F|nr:uncharacterized protein LOC110457087 [Mizuhopecten yessoensis]